MRDFTLLKMMLLTFVMAFSLNAYSTDYTFTFSAMSYSNAASLVGVTSNSTDGNLDITYLKNNSNTVPAYFTSGTAVRLYQLATGATGKGNSILVTAKNGATITGVSAVVTSSSSSDPTSFRYDAGSGEVDFSSASATGLSASSFECYTIGTTSSQRVYVQSITVTYTGGSNPETVTLPPTISPTSGNLYAPTSITLTPNIEGSSIYYTTDGSDPTTSSTLYTAPFTISADATVKAVAKVSGKDLSTIASATYIFPAITDASDIATLRGYTTGASKVYRLTGDAVITLKSATGNAKIIQDATGAILIYDANAYFPNANYNVGDKLNGIVGYTSTSYGMLQFVPLANIVNVSSTGNSVTPASITLDQMDQHPAQLVAIDGLTIAETGTFAASTNYTVSDGTNTAVLRTQYSDLPVIGQAIPTATQKITGIVYTYTSGGTTIQELVPISLTQTSGVEMTSGNETVIYAREGSIYVNNNSSAKSIEIYNVLGTLVLKTQASEGVNKITLPVKQLYLVKVGGLVKKVMVN